MKSRFFYFAGTIVAFMLIINLLTSLYRTYQSGQRVGKLSSQVEELQIQKGQLSQSLDYRQSPDFIEQQARDKLNLVKGNEKVVVFQKPKPQEGDTDTTKQNILNKSNLQLWRELFFGSNLVR